MYFNWANILAAFQSPLILTTILTSTAYGAPAGSSGQPANSAQIRSFCNSVLTRASLSLSFAALNDEIGTSQHATIPNIWFQAGKGGDWPKPTKAHEIVQAESLAKDNPNENFVFLFTLDRVSMPAFDGIVYNEEKIPVANLSLKSTTNANKLRDKVRDAARRAGALSSDIEAWTGPLSYRAFRKEMLPRIFLYFGIQLSDKSRPYWVVLKVPGNSTEPNTVTQLTNITSGLKKEFPLFQKLIIQFDDGSIDLLPE
ncbi:MAG: hypothetical protein R3A80_06835 [Bdellovibrionota bacterium]